MAPFNIPIVLFSFKRIEKILIILERISKIEPSRLYLISDGGRTAEEHLLVKEVRKQVENHVTWKCELIKRYSDKNIGVYNNIAGGAQWVFKHEEQAIFLEDDNLPELSFFSFCEEILNYYKDDTRILWICGTNYLKEYEPADHSSYVVTKNMMPCGWASWSHKFTKYYDGEFELLEDSYIYRRIRKEKYYKPLKKQDWSNWMQELRRKKDGKPFLSWDYQMSFTERIHNMYAIVPKYNQIENIGVDIDSIHGGFSYENEMTKRFCGLPTRAMEFPIVHPKALLIDEAFEIEVAKIITLPWRLRFKIRISSIIKKMIGIERDISLKAFLKTKLRQKIKSSILV